MGSFKELGEKADELASKAKNEGQEVKHEFNGMSKTMKYIVYAIAIIAVIAMGSCMLKGCGSKDVQPINGYKNPDVAYQQPIQPQTVVVQNSDPMAGVITGMAIGSIMSNGQRYDGHNGYDDSHYHGPKKVVVNKYYGAVNGNDKNTIQPPAGSNMGASSVQNAGSNSTEKVKNPGDLQAEKDKALDQKKADIRARIEAMKADRAAKEQAAAVEQRKADIRSRIAASKAARATRSSFSSRRK